MLALVILLAAAPATAPSPARADAPPTGLPADIARHYREYNTVNAFSTTGERHVIAEGRVPDDRRLRRIAALMDRVEGRIEDVDPGMVRTTGRWHETAARSDLVRVVGWRMDPSGEKGWATLDVRILEPASGQLLIRQFDALAGPDRLPEVERLFPLIGGPDIHSIEVHEWTRVDGQWRRRATTVHFVAQ